MNQPADMPAAVDAERYMEIQRETDRFVREEMKLTGRPRQQMEDKLFALVRQNYNTARQEGRDEVLKLSAKIVAKLEIAMMPDFATQIEQALREDMR